MPDIESTSQERNATVLENIRKLLVDIKAQDSGDHIVELLEELIIATLDITD